MAKFFLYDGLKNENQGDMSMVDDPLFDLKTSKASVVIYVRADKMLLKTQKSPPKMTPMICMCLITVNHQHICDP